MKNVFFKKQKKQVGWIFLKKNGLFSTLDAWFRLIYMKWFYAFLITKFSTIRDLWRQDVERKIISTLMRFPPTYMIYFRVLRKGGVASDK